MEDQWPSNVESSIVTDQNKITLRGFAVYDRSTFTDDSLVRHLCILTHTLNIKSLENKRMIVHINKP